MRQKKDEPTLVQFKFEEIELSHAIAVGAAGGSQYADIIAGLIKKLPALDVENQALPEKDRKSLAFYAPDHKSLNVAGRRNLVYAVNRALSGIGIKWKVIYSPVSEAFVCIPRNDLPAIDKFQETQKKFRDLSAQQKEEIYKRVHDLRKEGLSPQQITDQFKIRKATVDYLLYGAGSKKAYDSSNGVDKK